MQLKSIIYGTAILACGLGTFTWLAYPDHPTSRGKIDQRSITRPSLEEHLLSERWEQSPVIEDTAGLVLSGIQKNAPSPISTAAPPEPPGASAAITQASAKILDDFLAAAAQELAAANTKAKSALPEDVAGQASAASPPAQEDRGSDELSFYDYTTEKNSATPDPALSDKVSVPVAAEEWRASLAPSPSANVPAKAVKTPLAKKVAVSPRLTVHTTAGQNAALTLKIAEIKWGHELQSTRDFEFIPDDDSGERFDDYGRGQIEFQHKINNVGVRRGVILKRGFVPTSINLILESGQVMYEVPLASYDLWTSLQEKYHFFEKAGLLIDLDENIDEVLLDAPFAQALYLDEDFQETTSRKAYRYVWFIGVRPGNVQIAYRTFDNQETAQTILLKSDENHFLVNELRKGRSQQVQFTQRHLLSSTPQELDLGVGDISYFNFDLKLEKIGINALKYQRPSLPLGMREYFLINYLADTMAGTQTRQLELPGKEFQEQIYRDLDLRPGDGRCVAQINLPKKVFLLNAAAANGEGTLPLTISYLDRDGVMRSESSEQSQYALLVSEGLGSINVKVIYFDGSVDFLQTFCVPNTYFVEQL